MPANPMAQEPTQDTGGSFMPPDSGPPTTQNGLPMHGMDDQGAEGGGQDMLAELQSHLDALPKDEKEFVASYLTPETARLLGVLTGSNDVLEYFTRLANPNVVLVPVPRDKAQQFAAAVQGNAQSPQGGPGQPQPQQQQMAQATPPMGGPQ